MKKLNHEMIFGDIRADLKTVITTNEKYEKM